LPSIAFPAVWEKKKTPWPTQLNLTTWSGKKEKKEDGLKIPSLAYFKTL